MSDEIPYYTDDESRRLRSAALEHQPVLSETEPVGGETLPDQPLSGPAGDPSELPPSPEVAARSPKAMAMVMVLGVAAAGLAAFSGYELLQAKESQRLLDEANARAASVEIRSKNLESGLRKALSEKDLEIEAARADSRRLTENLAKEEDKNRVLQVHVDQAATAAQAKESLSRQLDSLKTSYRDLADSQAKVEAEVRRLGDGVASSKKSSSGSKTSSSSSKPTQRPPSARPPSAVERSVYQIANGPNKGRWYFVAANGFRSPLYASREGALRDAQFLARTRY